MLLPLPKTAKVGAHVYHIELSQELTDALEYGVTLHKPQLIRIALERQPSDFLRIYIHEVLHIIDRTWLGQHLEENEIGNLAEGLAAFLMDNYHIEGMTYDGTV